MKREHIHRTIAAFLCAVMVMAECPLLVQTTQAAEKNGLSESAIADMEMAPDKELEATLESEMAEYAQQATDIGVGISELSVSYSGGTWQYNNNVLQGYIHSGESVEQEAKLFFLNSSGQAASLEFTYGGYVKSGKPQGSESSITVPQREPIVAAATTSDATQVNLPPAGDDGKVRIDLQAGESACISMKAGTGNSLGGSMVYITISNITFTVKQDTSVTFGAAQNGSYTVKNANGETLNIGTAYPVESTMKFTVAATPDEGYKFLRWEVADGAQLSPEQSGELMAPTGGTVQPVFVTNDTPIFRVGTQAFDDLAEAIGCAQGENSAKTIVMTSDGALKEGVTYTIPAGVTLLVPYADARITETYMEQTPEESSGQNPWTINAESYEKAPYANRGRTDPRAQSDANVLSPVMDPLADGKVHRTLTIPATTIVRIEKGGVFSVGGVMSGGGHGTVAAAGGIIGQHSNIQLDGSIVVAGVFSCNGFVLGSGSITTESGGAIYEPFVVMDFHAGSWTFTAGMVNEEVMSGGTPEYVRLCPIFLRYTMPNIQTEMTIVSGARLYGYCDLIGGSQHNVTTGMIIGGSSDDAVIQLTTESSQVVMTYDAANVATGTIKSRTEAFAWVGKSTLNITGGASYGALSITVTVGNIEKPVSSSSFPLPLPYNVDITLADGSYAIDKHFYILPGANLTVGEGAELTLGGRNQTTTPKAQIAVFRGLYEHTLHGTFKSQTEDNIKYGDYIEYRYPTTTELQDAGFSGTGGLFVNGGALTIGEYAKFGGLIQSDVSDGTVEVHESSDLTANATVGIAGNNQAGIGDNAGYFTGKTGYELTAEVTSGGNTPFALVHGEHYSASAGSGTLSSYTIGWYPRYGTAKENTYTEAVSIPIFGCFERAAAPTTVATVYDGSGEFIKDYEVLADALNVANAKPGATVILKKEIPDGAINVTGKIVLDINGNSVKNTPITVSNGGDLTLKQATGKFGQITADKVTTMITVESGGRLALDGVTVSNSAVALTDNATNGAVCVENSGTIVSMKNVAITSAGGDALYNLGTIAEGVLADGNVFTGCRYAVYTKSAVNITGGTYEITGYTTSAGKKDAPGRAVLYCANTAGETNISGGSFTVDGSDNFCAAVYNAGIIGTITGGTYTDEKKNNTIFFNAAGGTIGKIENVSVTGVTAVVVQNLETINEIRGTDDNNKPVFSSKSSETILNKGTIKLIENYSITAGGGSTSFLIDNEQGTIQTIRNCTLHNMSSSDVVKNFGGTIGTIEACTITSKAGICVANYTDTNAPDSAVGKIVNLKNCTLTTTSGNAALSNTYGIIEGISGCTIENKAAGKPAVDGKSHYKVSSAKIGTISDSAIAGVKYALYTATPIDKITGGCQFKATGAGTGDGTGGTNSVFAAAVWNSATIGEISGGCTFTATGEYGHGLFNTASGKTPKIQDCTFTASGQFGFAFYNWGAFEDGVIQGCTFTASGANGRAFCNQRANVYAKIGTLKDCTFTATGTNGDALVNEASGRATLVQIDKIINCKATGTRCAVYNTCNSTGTGATAVINTISGGEFKSTTTAPASKDGTVYNLAVQGTAKIGTIQGCTIDSKHGNGNAVRNYKAAGDKTAAAEIGSIIDCDLTATFTALGNYVNSDSTGVGSKAVIEKIDGGTFKATNDHAITNSGGTINLISGGSFVANNSSRNALYSNSSTSKGNGAKASIGTISGGYFNTPGGAVQIASGTIGAVTGGIFVAGSNEAFKIGTTKRVVFGGVFKATGNKAKAPLDDKIIAATCQKVDIKNASIALPDGTTATGFYAVAPKNCTITVSGSGVADVSLDGMGSGYTATDKVTVAAPEVKGYTFTGWYRSGSEKPWRTDLVVKTTVAQMLADGLFDKTGTANLVAEYAEDETTAPLTLTLKGAPDDVTVGGGTKNSDGTWSVPVGTVVTIDANNVPGFQYWTNANDKVMSRGKTYTFTMVTNTTLTAETSTSNTFVIFQSADGRLLKAEAYSDSLKFPDAPYRVGYTFAGWKVGNAGELVQSDNLLDELKSKSGTVIVTAAYTEAAGTSYNVTASANVDGANIKGSGNSYKLGDIATFTAPETSSDGTKAFRFWASDKDGTNILSFSTTYSFRVTQDTKIFAIYGGTSDKPEVQPVVRVDNVLKNPDGQTKSLTFMIGASIPENYTLVEMGALYAKGSGDDTTLRVENVGTGGVLKAVSKLTQQKGLTDYSYALGFKIPDNNTTIYLRGYVAVKDSTETIYYYYSSVRFASYNNPNGTNS